MKKKLLLLLSMLAALILIGCASFSTRTFWAEKAATDSAYTAVTSWKAYFHAATNECALSGNNDKWTQLNKADAQINEASRQFSATVQVVESLRLSYSTNSTVKDQIPATLIAVSQQSSNIIWLVTYLKGL